MPALASYNDGNIPFGAQIVTLGGVDYVAEQIEFNEPSNAIDRKDEKGNINGAVYQAQKITGSATLQLATLTTPIPNRFDLVSLTYRNAPKTFILTKVGQPQKQDEIRKISVELAEKIN